MSRPTEPPRLTLLPPAGSAVDPSPTASPPRDGAAAAGGPLAERDDDALMLLASAGRADAFAVLVARYMKRLAHLCARLVCDVRTGEEIAQDTWLRVWNARRTYRPGSRFDVFLFTVARNLCRNHARDSFRRSRWLSDEEVDMDRGGASTAPSHLDALLARERQRRVQEAMASLEPMLREVLLFRFSEGLDYADIARIVDRTESAVRSRVHVAVGKLRAALGESDGEGAGR